MREEAKLIESTAVYEFDGFRVDAANRLLLRDGEVVPLTAKVFDLLLIFIENNGRLLAKDEMMRRIWPQSYVEEGNLTTNVSTLRKALGEAPKSHNYIVTVPGHGYKFVASVKEVQNTATIAVIAEQTVSTTVIEEEVSLPPVANAPRALLGTPEDVTATNETKKSQTRWLWAIPVVAVLLTVVWIAKERLFTPTRQIKSLAILPLKPLDAGENYLGAGIADAVIRRISQTGQLTVRPTSAVLRYLNQDTDALSAARQLNADAVLEGTIQRADDRLRVSVNLLRAGDGASLWADNFDMRMGDIFTIQDAVAQQVAKRLRLQLNSEQQARFNKRTTSNPVAYEYYVKGVYSFDQREGSPIAKQLTETAIDFFKKAIEADPDYALAHAQLSYTYAWKALFIEQESVWVERAKEELNRAEALDPQLAETHIALSLLLWSAYEGFQNEAAVRELLLAQQLDPNVGHAELASLYEHIGLEDSAAQELQRALDLDPTSEWAKSQILNLYFMGSKYDEWLAAYQKLYPGNPAPAWYFIGKGRLDEAQKALEEESAKEPNDPYLPQRKVLLLASKGDFRAAEAEIPAILRTHPRTNPNYHHAAYDIACIYALAGKSDEAVKWLKETAATGFPNYPLFERDPHLDRIRQTPEFGQFMVVEKARWQQYRQEFGG